MSLKGFVSLSDYASGVSDYSRGPSPVYKWNTAAIPVTKEAIDRYRDEVVKTINQESPFLNLLKQKTDKEMEALKKDINQEFWGEAPVRNEELRRCIGDAYDEHINEETPKEASMNTAVEKVMAERAEGRAREALVALDDLFEEYEVGSTRSWTVEFTSGAKVYNYAAVFAADGLWYITNRNGGVKIELLKGFLAEWAVEAHEVILETGTVL